MGRYALLVAASDYEDPYFAQLRSPAQDVRGLAELLRDPAIGGFEVTVLENAPDHEIRRVLDDLTADRRLDDLVLVYFSCHGLQDIHGRLHFATTGTRAARPASTAVAAGFVSERLEHSVAGGRLLMLDCCYSGAFSRGFAKSTGKPLDGEIVGSHGYVCLTACNEYEMAYEGDAVVLDNPRPSLFTETVIEGLRTGAADLDGDGWIETGELHRYVFDAVRPTGRQTPSYFAAGLQRQLRVARVPGNSPPRERPAEQVDPDAAMTRTPRFFAPRFPPFHFAREDRATPTGLAEAMVVLRHEAENLFLHEDERAALYAWIDHDVGDRDLERGILRKSPADRAAAEAAAATFIATFAPHVPATFRGRPANVAGLIALARAALGGDTEAGRAVLDLHRHNGLRILARHNCSDAGHGCGPGRPCAVLLAAAPRWDAAMPSTVALRDEAPAAIRPPDEAVAAQLLLMILDPSTLQEPYSLAGSDRDMPAWWLRLVLNTRVNAGGEQEADTRLARLAVAVLLHPAARAERAEVRDREAERWRETALDAYRRTGGAAAPARARVLPRRPVLVAAAASTFVLLTVVVGSIAANAWWRDPTRPADIYGLDPLYLWLNSLVGLLLMLPVISSVSAVANARRPGRLAVVAVVTLVFATVMAPAAAVPWRAHAEERLEAYARENNLAFDGQGRPIVSECGIKRAGDRTDVTIAIRNGSVDESCRVAEFYLNGLPTGGYHFPHGAAPMPPGHWWTASAQGWETIVVTALWQWDTMRWRFVGLLAASPDTARWETYADRADSVKDRLNAVSWKNHLVVEGSTGIYAIDLVTGKRAWKRNCPADRRFAGLGAVTQQGVTLKCGDTLLPAPG